LVVKDVLKENRFKTSMNKPIPASARQGLKSNRATALVSSVASLRKLLVWVESNCKKTHLLSTSRRSIAKGFADNLGIKVGV